MRLDSSLWIFRQICGRDIEEIVKKNRVDSKRWAEEDIFINLPIIAIYLQLSLQSGFDEEQSIAIHSEAFHHQL
jgi:hypothetical protein